jgi:hypothetical protein
LPPRSADAVAASATQASAERASVAIKRSFIGGFLLGRFSRDGLNMRAFRQRAVART